MSRDEMQLRDRLLMLSDPHKPFNVKRKPTLTKQSSKSGPKLSVQDFVRMDPGYTPDIEHLVFPMRKRNPQQVAPINPPQSKTRSRLAEMFALSRHLQQKSSIDKDSKRSSVVSRSVDSVLDSTSPLRNSRAVTSETARRWVSSVEEAVFQVQRDTNRTQTSSHPPSRQSSTKVSPAAETDRGPNISVLHVRNTTDPWETKTTTNLTYSSNSNHAAKNYFSRGAASSLPPLTKHQSLSGPTGAYKWQNSPSFHTTAEVDSPELFMGNTKRELSPVRWHDREVDGVYLNKSGWVQVEQRSLDENRRFSPAEASNLLPKKPAGKLADYHFNSEPANERPSVLSFQSSDYNRKSASPSPPPESPSVTPIISPPPAFQDKVEKGSLIRRSRTFFGKAPFLPRSNAIEDSDGSPPSTPQWKTTGKIPPSPLWNPSGKPIPSPQWKLDKMGKSTPLLRSAREKSPSSPRWKSTDNGPPSPLWNARKSPPSPLWNSRSTSPPSPLWNQTRKSPPSPLWNTSGKSPPNPQWRISPQSTSSLKTTPVVKSVSPIIEKPPRNLNRMPQTKSLEDTTTGRRSQFLQHYKGSSSSSSSSMGFRSLDSSFNRPGNIMPRLSENTDSSVDHYQDADEEDNNSSSINISMLPIARPNTNRERDKPPLLREKTISQQSREKINTTQVRADRISPSGRTNRLHHRSQLRRSPAGSDSNKTVDSSSSSSDEFVSKSPPGPPIPQAARRNISARSVYQPTRVPTKEDATGKVRRSRSLQLPEKKAQTFARDAQSNQTRISPQHPESHRSIVKIVNTADRSKKHSQSVQLHSMEGENLTEEMLREAEIVTDFVYGSRSRAEAQALLNQRFNSGISKEEKSKTPSKSYLNNGVTIYYVGNSKKEAQKVLLRGATSPILSGYDNRIDQCCSFWPQCSHRDSIAAIRPSHSYPTHQRSLDSSRAPQVERKSQDQHKRRLALEMERRKQQSCLTANEIHERPGTDRRTSPNISMKREQDSRKTSPINPKNRTPTFGTVSGSSSGSDAWLTASASIKTSMKSSGTSLHRDETSDDFNKVRETIVTRPGSAPSDERDNNTLEMQQRSMSLPKSFLSASYQPPGGTLTWQKHGTESVGSSPGLPRKLPTPEPSLTAPVTPLHENNRRRSPVGSTTSRRPKATSTPQLLEASSSEEKTAEDTEQSVCHSTTSENKTSGMRKQLSASSRETESVIQKFRKTFSLHFHHQRKSKIIDLEKDDLVSSPPPSLDLCDPSEEMSMPSHVPPATATCRIDPPASPTPPRIPTLDDDVDDSTGEQQATSAASNAAIEQKYKFGPLVWRNSKEKKKLTKAARNAKCNSGDSGIQIEIVTSCGGAGDSSESHDTDPPGDIDSPPVTRRRPHSAPKGSRPHSELLNQILIDKFKADLKQRAHAKHQQVRRTRSDLGGRRILNWDRSFGRIFSSPGPPNMQSRSQSPRKKPPDTPPDGVVLRNSSGLGRRGTLRRSLSQPLDIDKLSPLIRAKNGGMKLGFHMASDDERQGTSDDEMMSDSESSLASLVDRKKSLDMAIDEEMIILAEAVFDHVAIESEELAFRAGDVIEVVETANRDWWWGTTNGKSGWFPAQFVRLRVSQEDTVEDCLAAMASGERMPCQIRRRTSISLLSNDQVRTSVVRELVHTERDFVKVLQDVVEGYIAECRKRTDMFSKEHIDTIFINLEDILTFQLGFLKDLEGCIEWDSPYKSCVGSCFLKHRSGFKMYSDYCNSHPIATATLQELYQLQNYSKFFEACRLMRGLIEIPLDGYLLTPIQRICKYPLQLAELLKYTKADHPDYNDIKEALEAMRGVAMLINERKRRMESLEKLAAWQQRVEGWEGEDLIEISSQLIHQGEVVKVTTGMWTNNITLFLFDHQIVYCKKDILKRNTYVYKGRFCLDTSEVIDVPDGKDAHLGVTVRHAIKLYSLIRDKWLLFCCRSSNDKQRWLKVFAEERKLVAQDKDDGLDFPPSTRHLARISARSKRRPPRKPRNGKNYKHDSGYMGSTLQLNSTSNNSLGRRVGTWFTFAHKKTRHQHSDVS
ncbi:mucin-2 isoform X2 [Diorhabda carinulata]|uniref:mucin-2 isoform X2 n=1 Tax=Diorhabda carinulata TaxID=1163345 RepID=UPI0025A0ACA2|nr:mucin-2 isoform X2 [Diorhabda carinulata]